MTVKPFRMEVRLKNNRLIRAREEMGLNQAQAAAAIGIGASILGCFEGLGKTRPNGRHLGRPWGPRGWTKVALRIAEFYGYSPEHLWPDDVAAVRKSAFRLELAAADACALAGGELELRELRANVRMALTGVPDRERAVLTSYVLDEGQTLASVGNATQSEAGKLGLSRERTRQLVEKAARSFRTEFDRVERGEVRVSCGICHLPFTVSSGTYGPYACRSCVGPAPAACEAVS